ncbi:MAG: restriction endonuclease [Chloroflexi bacterium]|nr:restriction endonuclease [Chloroflexota bacterium]
MPVPDFQTFMLPLLRAAADGQPHRMRDLVPIVADELGLSEEDRTLRLPSGNQTTAENRTYWAGIYLRRAELLTSPARGAIVISEEGARVLATNPARIDKTFLSRYPAFVQWFSGARQGLPAAPGAPVPALAVAGEGSPEDRIADGWQELRNLLGRDLLDVLKRVSPRFFERLVIDLLLKMGYGGSRADASRLVGKPGDEGIDGTISEDKLGLDVVYVQAKRWEGAVGRPVVQAFAGSLQGFRAQKGVFITTSHFTADAREYAGQIQNKIVLIDGARLVDLMIEHNVGVETARTFELKKIDHDYFDDEAGPE